MIALVVLAVVVAVVVWRAPSEPRFADARRDLTNCVKGGGGSDCYQLPSVTAAIAGGWRPPSYWQIVEGTGYHQ